MIYIVQAVPITIPYPMTDKKDVTPDVSWDLQQSSLCRMKNIIRLEELPNIWQTIALPPKEKSMSEVEIACLYKA